MQRRKACSAGTSQTRRWLVLFAHAIVCILCFGTNRVYSIAFPKFHNRSPWAILENAWEWRLVQERLLRLLKSSWQRKRARFSRESHWPATRETGRMLNACLRAIQVMPCRFITLQCMQHFAAGSMRMEQGSTVSAASHAPIVMSPFLQQAWRYLGN